MHRFNLLQFGVGVSDDLGRKSKNKAGMEIYDKEVPGDSDKLEAGNADQEMIARARALMEQFGKRALGDPNDSEAGDLNQDKINQALLGIAISTHQKSQDLHVQHNPPKGSWTKRMQDLTRVARMCSFLIITLLIPAGLVYYHVKKAEADKCMAAVELRARKAALLSANHKCERGSSCESVRGKVLSLNMDTVGLVREMRACNGILMPDTIPDGSDALQGAIKKLIPGD